MNYLFPNLLIIGAMKSGTSSLYADLSRHPDIFFPAHKEPMGYAAMFSGDRAGIESFAKLYGDRSEKYLGDASTGYTKFPIRPNVAEIVARTVDAPKVIYITRDPILRVERHLAHQIGNGVRNASLLNIRKNIEYSCVSAYQMQISYWRAQLPSDAILEVTLEEYQSDRNAVIARIFDFLDLKPEGLDSMPAQDVNRGLARRSAYRSPLRYILHNRIYGQVREHVPTKIRRFLAHQLLPPALQSNVRLSDADRIFLFRAIEALNALDAPSAEVVRRVFRNVAKQMESV